MDKRKFWKYIGVFGIFTNLAVAAYYCYLESWTLSWVWHTVTRSFAGQSQEEVAGFFGDYVGLNSVEPIIFWRPDAAGVLPARKIASREMNTEVEYK